jgi:hypothetical protein
LTDPADILESERKNRHVALCGHQANDRAMADVSFETPTVFFGGSSVTASCNRHSQCRDRRHLPRISSSLPPGITVLR